MANNLTVAWAMPVEAVDLGVSIEAYDSAKETESALHDFIDDTPDGSAAKLLPPEIIEKIFTYAQQLHFTEHQSEWTEAWYCFCGTCSLSEHLSHKKYNLHKKNYKREENIEENADKKSRDEESDDEGFDRWLKSCRIGIDDGKHLSNIIFLERNFSEGPDPRNGDVKFKKARKLFAKDFGLEAHLQIFVDDPWEPSHPAPNRAEQWQIEDRLLLAYLILPGQYGVMLATQAGYEYFTSLHTAMIVNASIMKQPTEEERALFPKAMRALDLQLDVQGYWTEGRTTSERYNMTNGQLGRIMKGLANGDLLNEKCEPELLDVREQRRQATVWPQLMVFVSGTLDGER